MTKFQTANTRKRARGVRGGQKVKSATEKKLNKMASGPYASIVDDAPSSAKKPGVVEFGSKDKKMNMWFKKLAKRRKAKHQ